MVFVTIPCENFNEMKFHLLGFPLREKRVQKVIYSKRKWFKKHFFIVCKGEISDLKSYKDFSDAYSSSKQEIKLFNSKMVLEQ